MAYALDLDFDIRPANHWYYLTSRGAELVLDCYGGHIDGPDSVSIPRASPFKEVTVKNAETNMSLTGQRAMITVRADPGWNLQALSVGDKAVRVIAVRVAAGPKPKNPRNPFTPLIIAGCALAAAVAVLLVVANR